MDLLKRSLLDAPIIEKEGYHYFVHPISDGVPMLEPGLLREIVIKIINKVKRENLENIDKIVTPAAMGIHISTALSLATDIPLVVVRKRRYGLEGEVSLMQEGKFKHDFVWEAKKRRGRYIKVSAKNVGKLPEKHPAAGSDAWIFIDEIIIN